jgi:NAD+ diphosphatase
LRRGVRQVANNDRPDEDTVPLGFCGGLIDRAAALRSDPAWLAERRVDKRARVIRLAGDKIVLRDGAIATEQLNGSEAILLGLDGEDTPIFAIGSAEPLADAIDLRSIAVQGLLPPGELGLLAQARSLIHWHERHGFCAVCGAKTEIADAGYRRHCNACSADHFPRTDPVVIIVVRSENAALLGRQKSWAPGMYSALAGFMEPGETIEDAARREVFEESGIKVGPISYVASQPWPFPSSLMIGLLGEALTKDIRIDGNELEDARWFARDELVLMRDEAHPAGLKFPPRMAIANRLISKAIQLSC